MGGVPMLKSNIYEHKSVILYTAITILMCQDAIFLMMETGAGIRFWAPSPADSLAHVPGFTELSIGFWDWRDCATATNHSPAGRLHVWTDSSVCVGWITEKCGKGFNQLSRTHWKVFPQERIPSIWMLNRKHKATSYLYPFDKHEAVHSHNNRE